MIEADQLVDAARVAGKAKHPTDILVTASGFRVVASNGVLQASFDVPFEYVELCEINPLIAAIRRANDGLA